jgi:antibiotic biosynthesis monooxygenase (ABM) superfamily enzyme
MGNLQAGPSLIARCRFLALAIVGGYIVLNSLLAVCAPVIAHWPMYGITAVTVPPMVLTMIYLVIPLARRL